MLRVPFAVRMQPQVRHLFETVSEVLQRDCCDRMGVSIRCVQAFSKAAVLGAAVPVATKCRTRARTKAPVATTHPEILAPCLCRSCDICIGGPGACFSITTAVIVNSNEPAVKFVTGGELPLADAWKVPDSAVLPLAYWIVFNSCVAYGLM